MGHNEIDPATVERPGSGTRNRGPKVQNDPTDIECWKIEGARVVLASDHRAAITKAVEAERAKFHEYVRQYGRLGYDGPHLDHFLKTNP